MNVAIVTFHCSYNFGSALQAYALQAAIENLGHTATIIDYRSRNFDAYKLIRWNRITSVARSLVTFRRNNKRKEAFEGFWSRYFHLTPQMFAYEKEDLLLSLESEYDCFVCGSDQIWNLDCTHGAVGPFFLSFAGEKRRVAYAPSLAHTSFLPENFDKEEVAAYLSRFDYLSVREQETVHLFQPLVDKPIDVVLDPTLLLGSEAYLPMAQRKVVEGRYVFVYLLRQCPELVESACMLSAQGSKVVYISDRDLPIPGSINLFGSGPEEFVSLVANADSVLTNSFHACVFATLFRKPFRVFATDESGSRMRCLLGDLGLSGRIAEEIDADPIPDADWEDVQRRLDGLRRHSLDYLKGALS